MKANAKRWLSQEARALMTRLDRIRPFVLHETMVLAAAPSLAAQTAIEQYLVYGRQELRDRINHFLAWLQSAQGQTSSLSEAQQNFTVLKMQFNDILSQFDIFADVITQRSERENGVWLSGLDAVAADALSIPGNYFPPPPVVCYLDRGHGAAIRRARTRLPGGGENPVAVVRVPRERMVSSGIASSLVHEVGHQGAALLDLINSMRQQLYAVSQSSNGSGPLWSLFARWISEILADFWSVSRVGVGSTLGLMGVVSLPRAFVFRIGLDDPHPIPWIRVKISCAMGKALYPDSQWDRLASWWEGYYPLETLSPSRQRFFAAVEAHIPQFVRLLVEHRPPSLHGRSLGEVMTFTDRKPDQLRQLHQIWGGRPERMNQAAPSLVFAVIGQARADNRLTPEQEGPLLIDLLTYWALYNTLNASALCATQMQSPGIALTV
ncbi:MAG: hypothetical protein IPM53_20815 [Anaerolineaceae bacterium]|nr:hypothetical protein [Anaerolineaceae bacterium]